MTRVAFSPKVLESYGEFERYLESKETIERIREEAKKPYVPGEGRLGALSIAWLTATYPFRIHYALFLVAMGCLLYHASPFSKQGLYLYAEGNQQAFLSQVPINHLLSRGEILIDCMNAYSHDAYEIYTQEPISLDAIDWQVKQHLHPSDIDKQTHLNLASWGGRCGGMSEWIAYLYRETKYDFADPEHHLVSLVKQVRNGAPKEAALWQRFYGMNDPVLGLNRYTIEDIKGAAAQKVQEAFESLTPGFYGVYIRETKDGSSSHRINVVVTRDNTYLIEPNDGLVKITRKGLSEHVDGNYQVEIFEI